MLPRHFTVIRTRVYALDLQASSYGSFTTPLKKLGFEPYQTILAFQLGHLHPLGAYQFVHKDGRHVYLYFSRKRPFRFVVRNKKKRYASPFYETFDELEKEFCRHFKMANFTPEKRTVPTWPLR